MTHTKGKIEKCPSCEIEVQPDELDDDSWQCPNCLAEYWNSHEAMLAASAVGWRVRREEKSSADS